MTEVFLWVLNRISDLMRFQLSLTFEFFGLRVSLLHIEIFMFIIYVSVKLLAFSGNDSDSIKGKISFKRKENSKEKIKRENKESRWI